MITTFLLPHRFKLIGWCLIIPTSILGIVLLITNYEVNWLTTKVLAIWHAPILGGSHLLEVITNNVTDELVAGLFIIGALFISFSKEKIEDEFVSNLRLSSLLWAVGINYLLLLLSLIFIYETAFLTVMLYNMFTVLIIFIARFNYILYKHSKIELDEK